MSGRRTAALWAASIGAVLPFLAPASDASTAADAPAPALSSPEPAASRSDSAADSTARDEFVAALRAVRQHEADPTSDSPALRNYIIYDYLLVARLRRDLSERPGDATDAAVDAFLKAHDAEPVAHVLRPEWLGSLAQRGRWDWFLPRSTDVTQPSLVCYRLAGRLATGQTQNLAPDALARWGLPQRQPSECDGVFAWLHQQGAITPALAEARARGALVADNPRVALETVTDMPTERAVAVLQWAQLLQAPKPELARLAGEPSATVEAAALEAGFTRLSRTDAAGALDLLPGLLARPDVLPAQRVRLQRLAALGAAYSHEPRAIAAFEALPASAVDNDVQEWRARAALWNGDFVKARDWISQMPAALAAQPRWRYWRARTIGADTEARDALGHLASDRSFYGYLAADRVQRPYSLNARASVDDQELQDRLSKEPGLQRAHALFDCGLSDEASLEWAVALAGRNASTRLQAAHLAARWGWYSQSIATLTQAGELDDVRLRYPRPFLSAIVSAGRLTQLPPDWILAVMRQESLFRPDAVSRAGARGLMQMEPSTASAVARRWHLPVIATREAPFDPAPDVNLGAALLRELLDRYAGQLGVSLAAYNAGKIPVLRWLPTRPLDADVWIENIPYGETRAYVEHVLEHIVAFAWVRDAQPERLSVLLPQVEPTAYYAQTNSSAARPDWPPGPARAPN